jgi:hypothetical protein
MFLLLLNACYSTRIFCKSALGAYLVYLVYLVTILDRQLYITSTVAIIIPS